MFADGLKSFPKRKREKMQETIKWKCSIAGKTEIFTFWALTKIHPYCLRILKSTRDHICLKLWMSRFDLKKSRSRHHKIEIPWCSAYHICVTLRRAPVRCRLESNCFKINLWILYSRAFLGDRIGHQKYKQPFTGKPLKGFRLNCPRTLYCTEKSHLPNSLNVTGSISGEK